MKKLKDSYRSLLDQLENPGCEESMCEVMWNDLIYINIEELFEGVPKSTRKLIELNHI